jgi:hypothetical protein
MIGTVIVCQGNAWTPARFWTYTRIKKEDLKKYQKHGWVLVTWDVQLKEK